VEVAASLGFVGGIFNNTLKSFKSHKIVFPYNYKINNHYKNVFIFNFLQNN
jgi:hypothetical protein